MSKQSHGRVSKYNRLITAFVALGSLTYGYSASVIGSTIGQPGFYENFNFPMSGEPGYATITASKLATANGLFSAGAAVACLVVMYTAERFGRLQNIRFGAVLAAFGGALQAGAPQGNYAMFLAGRWICGMGIGFLVTVVPMYMSELAHPANRGWLVGHHAIFLVFGYCLSAYTGYGCYFATDKNPSFAWRFPLALQCLPPVILFIGSPWVPRSPRWLLSRGLTEEALRVLKRLHGGAAGGHNDANQDNTFALEEFYQIREQVKLEKERSALIGGPWRAVLHKPSYRRRMILGFMIQWCAEFGGPLVINNYSVIIYENLGETGGMPLLLSAIWLTTAGLIYNPGGAWLHDRVNSRKKMFLTGLVGCVVTLSIEAALTAQYAGTSNKAGNAVAILFVFLYLMLQGTFNDTTMYLWVSEIFPQEVRSIGMGFSLFGQFAATILLLQTAPLGFANVGWKYFLVNIIFTGVVSIPFIWYYGVETAQLTLEDINAQFGDDVAVDLQHIDEAQRRQLDEFLEKTDVVHNTEIKAPVDLSEHLEHDEKSEV